MVFTGLEICPKDGGTQISRSYMTAEQAKAEREKIQLACISCGYKWQVDPKDYFEA